jgi:hypothetical protein
MDIETTFDVKQGGEDSKFGYTVRSFKDSYDLSFTVDAESLYYCLTCTGNNIMFGHICFNSSYAVYSEHCYNSHNIFGCEGLRGAEYCILNKQYTKEEYEALVPRIIEHMKSTGEWGKWYPISMSPFAYNEAIVNEYSPRTKEDALAHGYRWKDDLPATRGQGKDDADPMKRINTCTQCDRNFRFIDRELLFYKKMDLPLPTQCFNCRHMRRMNLRLPRKLWKRQCAKCDKEIETSYAPNRPEIVYCETCYKL